MNSQPPINLNLLIDILGTDEEDMLTEWLTLFIDTFPPMLAPMEIALENQHPTALYNAAHDAKSASSSIAAPRLTTLLKYLEIEASSKNWDSLSETIEEVKLEFDLIVQFSGSR